MAGHANVDDIGRVRPLRAPALRAIPADWPGYVGSGRGQAPRPTQNTPGSGRHATMHPALVGVNGRKTRPYVTGVYFLGTA